RRERHKERILPPLLTAFLPIKALTLHHCELTPCHRDNLPQPRLTRSHSVHSPTRCSLSRAASSARVGSLNRPTPKLHRSLPPMAVPQTKSAPPQSNPPLA